LSSNVSLMFVADHGEQDVLVVSFQKDPRK
jgi:hypothetical protein